MMTITVGGCAGYDMGVRSMNKGERAEILLPAELAYGPAGQGSIPVS